MLKLKLKRIGRKKEPFYHLVINEALSKRNSKEIAYLGYYNPFTKEIKININKLQQYLYFGAQPTCSANKILTTILKAYL